MKGSSWPQAKANEIKEVVFTVEGGELGRWCELGQNFRLVTLLLLVKGHWCAILRKCSAHCDPCDCVLLLI